MAHRLSPLALIGALIFTFAWIVLGAISPGYELFGNTVEPYSWVSQPVSGLGLGGTAAWMNTAFVLGGLLLTAGVLSTIGFWWRGNGVGRAALCLMSFMGLGMIVCGVFTLESMMFHLTGFLLAIPIPAIGLFLAAIAVRPDSRSLAVFACVSGVIALVLFVVFMAVFEPVGAGNNESVAGLLQRALIVATMTGVVVVTLATPGSRSVPRAHPSARP